MLSCAPRTELAALVALACRAPSLHNSQPWRWRVEPGDRDGVLGTVELLADPSRLPDATDADGRLLRVSCGAALHHLRVGAAAHGWATAVDRLPDVRRPEVLARVSLARGEVAPTAEADLAAIAARVTDRRRFTSWPVPDARLEHLAAVGSREGAEVVPLLDLARRRRLALLVDRAREHPAGRPSPDRGPGDGGDGGDQSGDGVLVVATAGDETIDHLRAGEALSALWLRATTQRLSVVPLSQVVADERTRDALRTEVLGGALHPQLVVRLGWQEIARSTLPRTPRRGLGEVLVG